MRVLVTGANGYIASNLVRYLVLKKYKVTAIEQEGPNLDKLEDLRGKIDVVKMWLLSLKNWYNLYG